MHVQVKFKILQILIKSTWLYNELSQQQKIFQTVTKKSAINKISNKNLIIFLI